jgi:molybdopterin/thiamine biosynthesis adenylyltransferase
MSNNEHFFSRLEIQKDWNLKALEEVELVLNGSPGSMIRTLALASACSGFRNLCLVGGHRDGLFAIADDITDHLGLPGYGDVRIKSPGTYKLHQGLSKRVAVYMIDAGDRNNDNFFPDPSAAVYYYADCVNSRGCEHIAVGTDRQAVAERRFGQVVRDRAEISAACSLLVIAAMAGLRVCTGLEGIPRVGRIPLGKIPDDLSHLDQNQRRILYAAGGGGAIAHQILWAESQDPVLSAVNKNSKFIIVDPKSIHASCRSRQILYPPESLYGSKADWTAKWVRAAFPGAAAEAVEDKISESNFHKEIDEVFSSIDNWAGRKVLARLCKRNKIPWWSTGSSFFGGFARLVDHRNPYCSSVFEGVERLNQRPDDDDDAGPDTSCTSDYVPMPSSVLPQMILGSWIAAARRNIILGQADPKIIARGIEVHTTHSSEITGYEGLRWSPGRLLNLKFDNRKTHENQRRPIYRAFGRRRQQFND